MFSPILVSITVVRGLVFLHSAFSSSHPDSSSVGVAEGVVGESPLCLIILV